MNFIRENQGKGLIMEKEIVKFVMIEVMILIKFLMQRNAINQISKALSKKWCLFNITLIVSIGDGMTFRCVIELKN